MSFHSKFKFDYKTNCCKSVPGYHIATNFYTCHDSTVVVTGANICSNNIVLICTTAQHFRYIWVAWEKLLMQQVPWQNPLGNYTLTYYIDSWISYHQIFNISHTLLGNKIAPTTFIRDLTPGFNRLQKSIATWDEKYLSFGIPCVLF